MGLSDNLLCSGGFFKLGVDGDVNKPTFFEDDEKGLLSLENFDGVVGEGTTSVERGDGDKGVETVVAGSENANSLPAVGGVNKGECVRTTTPCRPISRGGRSGTLVSRVDLAALDVPNDVPLVSETALDRFFKVGADEGFLGDEGCDDDVGVTTTVGVTGAGSISTGTFANGSASSAPIFG